MLLNYCYLVIAALLMGIIILVLFAFVNANIKDSRDKPMKKQRCRNNLELKLKMHSYLAPTLRITNDVNGTVGTSRKRSCN